MSRVTQDTRSRGRDSGFSLIELIVVITIIGILASVVVVNISGRSDQAKVVKAKAEIKAIADAAEMYKLDSGLYPQDLEELMNPTFETSTGSAPKSYLKKRPRDPWTQDDYGFELLDDGVRVYSFGADMTEGGDGINTDLSNIDEF